MARHVFTEEDRRRSAAMRAAHGYERRAEAPESTSERAYFGVCAERRRALMAMRRERSMRFVTWDEPTTPSAAEAASWEA